MSLAKVFANRQSSDWASTGPARGHGLMTPYRLGRFGSARFSSKESHGIRPVRSRRAEIGFHCLGAILGTPAATERVRRWNGLTALCVRIPRTAGPGFWSTSLMLLTSFWKRKKNRSAGATRGG